MNSQHVKALLERLNEHCVRALEGGAELAAARGHGEVAIEHVVLRLLEAGGGDFDRLLHQFDLSLDRFWQGLLDNLSRQRFGHQGKPAFSLPLFQWLERAWMVSTLQLGQSRIRSGALLLALAEMAPLLPGEAFLLLDGLPLERIRHDFAALVAGSLEDEAAPAAAAAAGGPAVPAGGSSLDNFTSDFTARAGRGEIDPVLGRNDEIRQMIDILTRRRKNNPLLVGEPGVGKTAVVEGLALRIAEGTVPDALKGVRLCCLDLGLLQAGAGVKGEFEKRLKNVIDEVKNAAPPVILFIDEAHTLIGAGGDAGMGDAANLLKPALARGELRTIAATTWSEYKKYFERDAALERRFQLVKIDEPSEADALVMLGGLKELYQRHHGVLVTDDAVQAAVRLASRYINDRRLPDKAIDLLDTAAARVRMGHAAAPAALDADREHAAWLERRLAQLEEERGHGLPPDARLLATLEQELAQTRQRLEALQQQWRTEVALVETIQRERAERRPEPEARARLRAVQGAQPLVQPEVNADAVAEVVAEWTGIPVGRMLQDDIGSLLDFETLVGQRVIGQEEAVAAIGEAIRTGKAGLRPAEAPLGVFLLAGPSGVGKSETARAIAEQMFGGERSLVTINMSEYQEAHSVSQLKGSPPGYVGYGQGGILTEAVRQRPYSVILLDEVEKAHPDVLNLFYQVFDRGSMRDGEGREIDFCNCVLLLTSNLGAEQISELCAAPPDESDPSEPSAPSQAELVAVVTPELQRRIAPALLARMQLVPLRPLTDDALRAIVALKLDQVARRLHAAHGITLRCAPEVVERLAGQGHNPDTGARYIQAIIDRQLLPGIARSLLGFMAEGAMPDLLDLQLDEAGELVCEFADWAEPAAEVAEEEPAAAQA